MPTARPGEGDSPTAPTRPALFSRLARLPCTESTACNVLPAGSLTRRGHRAPVRPDSPSILSVSRLRVRYRYPFAPVLLVCRAGELEHYLVVACSQASWRAEAEPARGQERSRAHSPRTHFSSLACCVSLRVPGARAQFERMMREELERHIESKVTLSGPRQYPS